MPNTNISADPLTQTMWYAWDISNIHFVSYSTQKISAEQLLWLEEDLTIANTNRYH